MKLFGITGGIGSGKSFVCNGLRQSGFDVYDTDVAARRIMQQNPMVRSQIELLFGSDIYTGDRLDRKRVAEQVFQNPLLLQKLNHIVHPAVRFDLEQWAKNNSEKDFCFVESAILFESGLHTLCNAVICISAPLETRINRTRKRDNATREQVTDRMSNQMPDIERENKADIVIINNENSKIENLCLQITEFCRNFAG